MQLSASVLWTTAFQCQTLIRFADEFPLPSGANAPEEAARFLRDRYGLEAAEWTEVEAFAQENRSTLEDAERNAQRGSVTEIVHDDKSYVDAFRIIQEWRLLFSFAVQFTLYAAELAEDYLCQHRGLSSAEQEEIHGALREVFADLLNEEVRE